jgi:hypothetical protein
MPGEPQSPDIIPPGCGESMSVRWKLQDEQARLLAWPSPRARPILQSTEGQGTIASSPSPGCLLSCDNGLASSLPDRRLRPRDRAPTRQEPRGRTLVLRWVIDLDLSRARSPAMPAGSGWPAGRQCRMRTDVMWSGRQGDRRTPHVIPLAAGVVRSCRKQQTRKPVTAGAYGSRSMSVSLSVAASGAITSQS